MKKILWIYGLPASGKTTISLALCEYLFTNGIMSYYLNCDEIAKITVHCQYTNEELDLKYNNIASLLTNLFRDNKIIIVDDNFKRQKDADYIYNYVSNATNDYSFIKTYLSDGYAEAKFRNKIRASNSIMPADRLKYYYENYSNIDVEKVSHLETSTSLLQSINFILSKIGL